MSLPIVLAGPILRRVTSDQVCIWIATSQEVKVEAKVFHEDIVESSPIKRSSTNETQEEFPRLVGIGNSESIALGKHLHITLVSALPVKKTSKAKYFPSNVLLSYDLELIQKDLGVKLADVIDIKSITYEYKLKDDQRRSLPRPTFFLPEKNKHSNILHGSCRKLHGKGNDCLVVADRLIENSLLNFEKRPSILFLTGDQIYADDVAAPIIKYLTEFGNRLLGWDEEVPKIGELSKIPYGQRKKKVNSVEYFITSSEAENHLLGFGEFSAMYLLAWNSENWPEKYGYSFGGPTLSKWNEQVKTLEKTKASLPAVRRALANIPTYMIFDDHEITDDWNLDEEWSERVKKSSIGRRMVTNGLVAYWVFQAWGNDPSLYTSDLAEKVIKYLAKPSDEGYRKSFETFFMNFHKWAFAIPTDPVTVFLNTRTQRKSSVSASGTSLQPSKSLYRQAPHLLKREGLEEMFHLAIASGYTMHSPIMIVSPAPVYGYELHEEAAEILYDLSSSPETGDREHWHSNLSGFNNFINFIIDFLKPQYCIFLSGDVHYAFTISALLSLTDGRKLSMTQLTSSALKNTGILNKLAELIEKHKLDGGIERRFGWNKKPTSRTLGDIYSILSMPFIDPVQKLMLDLEKIKIESKLARLPVVLSSEEKLVMNIIEKHDWIEDRQYERMSGSTISTIFGYTIFGDNNMGLIQMSDSSSYISHTLYTIEDGRLNFSSSKVPKIHKFKD